MGDHNFQLLPQKPRARTRGVSNFEHLSVPVVATQNLGHQDNKSLSFNAPDS
jgi:hypothetical protein